MQGFIKVSNRIFDYNLSSKAIYIYVYLSSKVNCLQYTNATYEDISCACNMDTKTAKTGIDELINKGLVTKQNRFNSRGYLANRYYIKNLITNNLQWFKVDRAVFKTNIKATDFVVFCFISKCMCSKKQEAFPSLSAISLGTGISRGRVSQAVQYLRHFTFINRIRRRYKHTLAFRHNRYMHFKCNVKKGKKRAYTWTVQAKYPNYSYILPYVVLKINTFMLN
ncbi:hypothetical protein RBG61_06580 [Paludicola sp. MB14-C6]|uniref:hypothetical protein n=1 Tax=Paludihabitans sp. MB14-C6 TaxID=3070656 RepID=UPI0027DAB8CB|nr:hypothetical protein [Paludicola sp. MB14-C6]WMJ24327.1 hypothetical protein RBG61_06580 [Paludicola sp. MB14-C6]